MIPGNTGACASASFVFFLAFCQNPQPLENSALPETGELRKRLHRQKIPERGKARNRDVLGKRTETEATSWWNGKPSSGHNQALAEL